MARAKRTSKQKRRRRAFPALGAAGVSLAVAGGASATVSTANVPPRDTELRPVITLDEEEISDVSLAMSSTRKPPEHLSSAKAYNLQPAAEVAAAEAAEGAQFEAAEAAAAQVAEAA